MGEQGVGLVDRRERRAAQVIDPRRPRAALGGGVGLGIVEALLQEERLPQPPTSGVDDGSQLERGSRPELRLDERHLALGVADRIVGLHDPCLRLHLDGPALLELAALAASSETAHADDRPAEHDRRRPEDDERGQPPETIGHGPDSRPCA